MSLTKPHLSQTWVHATCRDVPLEGTHHYRLVNLPELESNFLSVFNETVSLSESRSRMALTHVSLQKEKNSKFLGFCSPDTQQLTSTGLSGLTLNRHERGLFLHFTFRVTSAWPGCPLPLDGGGMSGAHGPGGSSESSFRREGGGLGAGPLPRPDVRGLGSNTPHTTHVTAGGSVAFLE